MTTVTYSPTERIEWRNIGGIMRGVVTDRVRGEDPQGGRPRIHPIGQCVDCATKIDNKSERCRPCASAKRGANVAKYRVRECPECGAKPGKTCVAPATGWRITRSHASRRNNTPPLTTCKRCGNKLELRGKSCYCSDTCRKEARKEQLRAADKRARERESGRCTECGGPTSRKVGGYAEICAPCRKTWRAA